MKTALALLGLLGACLALYFYLLAAPGPEVKEVPPLAEEMEPAPATASSTATATRVRPPLPPAPPSPIQTSTPALPKELSAAIAEASRALPTTAELRKLPHEALHRMPAPVLKANAALGQVAEALEREPARAGEGLAFYGECARRAEVATSVRALCLTKMRQLSGSSGLPAVEDGIAADVKDLSDFTLR